jgi:PAS domain S-box-containing protein
VLATLWILISGFWVATSAADAAAQNRFELLKGLTFVAVTSVTLYLLLRRWYGVQQRLQRQANETFANLEASEQRLMDAQSLARLGSWHVVFGQNDDQDVWTASRELRRIYGVGLTDALSLRGVVSRIAPEDRAMAIARWDAAKQRNHPEEWEHRILVDGQVRWVRVVARFDLDANGKAHSASGTDQDITERKQAEQELRIAATAFETQEAMFITDANLTIIKTNRAFTEITGFAAEEAIGQRPSMLSSGRHAANFY